MLKYTVACTNKYFRLLHAEGLWMEPETTFLVVEAGNEMCASRLYIARVGAVEPTPRTERNCSPDLRLDTSSWLDDATRGPGNCSR